MIGVNLSTSRRLRQPHGYGFHCLPNIPHVMLMHEEASDDHMSVTGVAGSIKVEKEHVK